MTDKRFFSFVLLPMLALTLILGLLVLNSPARAAEGAGDPVQAGLTAWNPLRNALIATLGVDGLAPVGREPAEPDACTPDTSSMMSYWPLDETSGTAFTDVVDGNPGACTDPNCPAPATGIVAGAQSFNSTDKDGILITEGGTTPLIWANADSFSFEMWVNFTEVCTDNKVFFGRYSAALTSEARWWVGCTPGGYPAFLLKSANAPAPTIMADEVAINDGQWHHVVAVRDAGANTNLLYVDGVEAISAVQSYTTDFTSTGPITIGYYPTSAVQGYWFNGLIDEVAVYDKALSATEIENHYNNGAGQSYCSEPPVAVDDNLQTDENTDLDFTADDLLANDSDPDGSELAIDSMDVASTEGGTITDHLDGTYTYSPLADFNGTDTFTYTISAGGETDTATVFVEVLPVNDPPVALPQSVETDEDVAVDITLEATDLEDDALTFSVVDEPLHGTLSGTAPDLTYTPDADYTGADSFTFQANDGIDDSNVATVSITINPVADGPSAQDDVLATDEDTALDFADTDLLANDSHPDGIPFGITAVDAASVEGGTIDDLGGGSYQYTPPENFNGTDSFTYTVEDDDGASDTATVVVTVNAVNHAPVAKDQEVTVDQNGVVDITLVATDVDGDDLTFTVVDSPLHGVLTGSGAALTYTPDTDFSGSDGFTFMVNDGTVDSNVATVTITVNPVGGPTLLFLPLVGKPNV